MVLTDHRQIWVRSCEENVGENNSVKTVTHHQKLIARIFCFQLHLLNIIIVNSNEMLKNLKKKTKSFSAKFDLAKNSCFFFNLF